MSFISGGQTELLYSMQSSGSPATAAASTVITQAAATAFAFPLSTFYNEYGVGSGVGKSFMVKAGGWFTIGSTAVTQSINLAFDTTAGTAGTTLAKTGAFTTTASVTDGLWAVEAFFTLTAYGTSGTVQGFGDLTWGTGNNATTTAAACYMMGAAQSTVTVNTLTAATTYLELFSTWSATTGAPTITCTNFLVFGLN